MHIKETPFVESLGIGEEDIGWVSVHVDGSARDCNHLASTPAEGNKWTKEIKDGKHDLGGGIDLRKLPEAQNGKLRETNEGNTVQDALENGTPAITELEELVRLHHTLLSKEFAETLEQSDAEHGEDGKEPEKGQTREKEVGRFDLGLERYTLDSVHNIASGGRQNVTASFHDVDGGLGHHVKTTFDDVLCQFDASIQTTLLDSDGHRAQGAEEGSGRAAGGSLIPGEDALHEVYVNDAHGPLEVLGPRLDNGGQANAGQADHGLGLEVAKQGQREGSDVSGRVGVSESIEDGGRNQSDTGNDGGSPLDTGQVDRLAVGDGGLDTSNTFSSAGKVDAHSNAGIEIGHGIGDGRDVLGCGGGDVEVEGDVELGSGRHGAHTTELDVARVDGGLEKGVAIGRGLDVELDVALDGRRGHQMDRG